MSNEKHGEGCGCYWCLPKPGVSPPPTWAEVMEMERQVESGRFPYGECP